jgi:pilus assembly protein CpaB
LLKGGGGIIPTNWRRDYFHRSVEIGELSNNHNRFLFKMRCYAVKKIQLLAILFALIAGVSVYFFLNSLQQSSVKDYVDVVVAVRHIDMKTQLTTDMLKYKKMPAEVVHPLSALSIAEVVGYITQDNLETDEPLLTSQLLKTGQQGGGLAYMIPEGCRAVTILVDNVGGVSGFLKTGDRVDVLVEIDIAIPPSTNKVSTSIMLLENIEVLTTGSTTTASSTGTYDLVTLVVTPEQSLKLNLADTTGKIRLSLRPPLDKKDYKVTPKTAADIP